MKRKLLILPLLALLLGTSGCAQKGTNYQQYKRYIATLNNDETPTYEEWLESMKGQDGKDGAIPEITVLNNGHYAIDGKDTGVNSKGVQGETGPQGLKGDKGDKGEAGEDAVTPYELYKNLHPDYTKTEDEFYLDLANGNAGEQVVHTVSFTYNGEEILVSQTVVHGEKAINPGAPYMPGLTFINWMYEGEVWNFNASVTEDLQLVATFE